MFHQRLVQVADALGHRPLAGSDWLAVDLGDRGLGADCAGQEYLFSAVRFVERVVLFKCGDTVFAARHNKEVSCIRRVHEAMRVEHQRFVRARQFGLQASNDAVKLGMTTVLRIPAHRQAAHLSDGGQPNAPEQNLSTGLEGKSVTMIEPKHAIDSSITDL